MFPSSRTSAFRQRAFDALGRARSFLMLEDDYDVDWEVDQDELARIDHPHRAPLRGSLGRRRPGQLPHAPQVCISPVVHEATGRGDRRARRVAQPCEAAQQRATPASRP
ncbi:MAG TPA: hypothetical protein VK790_07035 [Solirubrobacteraceae bacterium]|nr:hypothetical protein [Solirubrobacteraceae bacterium]